jgi:alcohol dehydrogenase class IV
MYFGDVADWPKRIRFGAGSLRELPQVMEQIGARRAVILCGQSVAKGPMFEMVTSALGAGYAGVFTGVRAHTPFEDVSAAAAEVRRLDADTVISVGGGSAIDAAKGVVLVLATGGDLAPYAIEYAAKGMTRRSLGASPIRHIAVPTTAGSASDVMPTAGIRDASLPRKMLFWDQVLVPDATILDPEMAVFAGPELTAASGMTAVARSIESLYSKHRHPISTALALHAARLMRVALPVSVAQPGNLAARADCQMACVMSGMAAINSMVSIVHAIGHVVGGRHGLQHGVSHGMLLAPALRKLLPVMGENYSYVLDALGCAPSASASAAAVAAAAAVDGLLAQLPLPRRLRDVGVTEDAIADIARITMGDYMMANLPVPLSVLEVELLLREAW